MIFRLKYLDIHTSVVCRKDRDFRYPVHLSAHKDRIPLVVYGTYFTSVEVWPYIGQVCEKFT